VLAAKGAAIEGEALPLLLALAAAESVANVALDAVDKDVEVKPLVSAAAAAADDDDDATTGTGIGGGGKTGGTIPSLEHGSHQLAQQTLQ